MKKILAMVGALVLSISINTVVWAMPVGYNPNDYTSTSLKSELLPETVKSSKAQERRVTRGNFFSGADLVVTDRGGGDVGALAIGYLDVPAEEVYITVYLDKWDEKKNAWMQVAEYDAEFYAADYPDGLITPTVDIAFKKQKIGYYYRLRGVFSAVYNDEFEGFSPVTSGILLE